MTTVSDRLPAGTVSRCCVIAMTKRSVTFHSSEVPVSTWLELLPSLKPEAAVRNLIRRPSARDAWWRSWTTQHRPDLAADLGDVVARERLVGRQGEDRLAQALRHRELAAAVAQLLRRRLQVDRGVVVHDRLNTPGGQVLLQLVAAIALGDEVHVGVKLVRLVRGQYDRKVLQELTIEPGVGPAPLDHGVEPAQPEAQDGGLKRIEPRHVAEFHDGVAIGQAVIAQ